MKVTVHNIGIAERNVIGAVLDEIPPSKSNRALVKAIRQRFNLQGLRDELNMLRSIAIQKAMAETLDDNLMKVVEVAVAKGNAEQPMSAETKEVVENAIERVVRTVAGPQMLKTASLSWEELLVAKSEVTSYDVDKTDLKIFRKFYDEKEDWAWKDKDRKESMPPPSALHEVLANLDEALDQALKE